MLATPELTVSSPYIDTNSFAADAVYERIPQQIMGLLHDDPPRLEVYAFGQALKPAEHSIVTSGPYFGLCTNYQVTAEVATRTVVRIDGSPDPRQVPPVQMDPRKQYPPQAVVESFNSLPPF